MADAAVLIVFGEGFEPDDIAMHEALVRGHDAGLAVHSFVLTALPDLAAVHERAAAYAEVVVWNNYWPVDDISAALAHTFPQRLVGSRPEITRHTTLKSDTHQRLAESGIACPWWALVAGVGDLADLRGLGSVPYPVIAKPDAGYDTVDMATSSRCEDAAALHDEVARLAALGHDRIIVQQFLAGREFTVAFANHRAFCPIEKRYPAGRSFYLSGAPYDKHPCHDPVTGEAVRTLARKAAWAFGLSRTDYCRIDIREDAQGRLFVIDVNDMCSVYPNGQFEASLAADGLPRTALAGWLTAPLALAELAAKTRLYIPFHKDFSQVENLVPFLRRFRCTVLLYRWADGAEEMAAWFRRFPNAEVDWFSVDGLGARLERERDPVILLLTDTPDYFAKPAQREFFTEVQRCFPIVREVVSLGHCLAHSTCDSCGSDVGDIPIKYTAHRLGLLPFDAEELRRVYAIDAQTVLVSPTTGDDHILLARHDLLAEMKAMQDAGLARFLFKLHPSTEMMAFDDDWFQLEKAGYAYVRQHFQRVAPEHFSIFAFTGLVRRHVGDLYSSVPALLTAFDGLDIIALDNPAVAADHPLREHIQVVSTPAELRAALLGTLPAPGRQAQAFWQAHYPPVSGSEILTIALERGWLHPQSAPAAEAGEPDEPDEPDEPGRADTLRQRITAIVSETRQRHARGEADDDALDSLGYYFEQPLSECRGSVS